MVLTAHQPSYLPWLGFFHKVTLSDVFVLLDNLQFDKNSKENFINRNKIKTANGGAWLTIPLEQKGNFRESIINMKICKKNNWAVKHYKSIYSSYRRADYFDEYISFFENYYDNDSDSLIDFLKIQLNYLLSTLNIGTKVFLLSELPVEGKKQELMLNLCKYFNADKFIFGKLGADYADKNYFKSHNVEIYFQDYMHPTYKQLWGDFIPFMSVIDLLFNEGKNKALDIIMQNNITKDKL